MTLTIYDPDGISPTQWASQGKDPIKIALPHRKENRLIRVIMLDKTAFPQLEIHRRVYHPAGIAPTIHTCGGGGTEPKIIVEDCR